MMVHEKYGGLSNRWSWLKYRKGSVASCPNQNNSLDPIKGSTIFSLPSSSSKCLLKCYFGGGGNCPPRSSTMGIWVATRGGSKSTLGQRQFWAWKHSSDSMPVSCLGRPSCLAQSRWDNWLRRQTPGFVCCTITEAILCFCGPGLSFQFCRLVLMRVYWQVIFVILHMMTNSKISIPWVLVVVFTSLGLEWTLACQRRLRSLPTFWNQQGWASVALCWVQVGGPVVLNVSNAGWNVSCFMTGVWLFWRFFIRKISSQTAAFLVFTGTF